MSCTKHVYFFNLVCLQSLHVFGFTFASLAITSFHVVVVDIFLSMVPKPHNAVPFHAADPDVSLKVYLLGNPVVVWGTTAGIVLWLVSSALYLHVRDTVDVPPKAVRSLSMCRCGFGWRQRAEGLACSLSVRGLP